MVEQRLAPSQSSAFCQLICYKVVASTYVPEVDMYEGIIFTKL